MATDETKPRAADALKLTSRHLKNLGVIDDVIAGAARRSAPRAAGDGDDPQDLPGESHPRTAIARSPIDLLDERYDKFRRMGVYLEAATSGAS